MKDGEWLAGTGHMHKLTVRGERGMLDEVLLDGVPLVIAEASHWPMDSVFKLELARSGYRGHLVLNVTVLVGELELEDLGVEVIGGEVVPLEGMDGTHLTSITELVKALGQVT